MTAKEALLHRVNRLSEEEAAAVLDLLRLDEDPLLLGEPDLSALDALIERKRQRGPSMSEEQWDELARAMGMKRPIDEHTS